MATAGDLFDMTGRMFPNIPAGTKNSSTSGTAGENSTTQSSQQSNKSFSGQNTPQFALNALQELIASLSDKNNVSLDDANIKAPATIRTWSNGTFAGPDGSKQQGGWIDTDPLTGKQYMSNDPAVAKLNAERSVQREKIISEGGVTAGGTIETRRATTDRQTEIARNREQQGKYSKEAAFADASQLQGRFTRQLLEQLMPNINKAVESSGTSGGAVAGIMAQDAAARTAEAQSALGLQTSAQYGQLYDQLAGTLELLTRDASPTTKALLEAIGLSRGTISLGNEANSASGISSTTGTKTSTGTGTEVSKAPSTPTDAAAPLSSGAGVAPNTSTPYQAIRLNQRSDDSFQKLLDALIAPDTSGEYRF